MIYYSSIQAVKATLKGKRQNTLLPEHIEKIVDTFKHRKKEERYSSRFEWKKLKRMIAI
jgi:type I restriction enzyme M protein